MRYQDYVIKNGEFIGEFDEMYKNCEDPWKQSQEIKFSYSRHATVNTIKKYNIHRIIEFGSGLGYFTNYLSSSYDELKIIGVDISKTATKRAKQNFPENTFLQENARNLYDIMNSASEMWGGMRQTA